MSLEENKDFRKIVMLMSHYRNIYKDNSLVNIETDLGILDVMSRFLEYNHFTGSEVSLLQESAISALANREKPKEDIFNRQTRDGRIQESIELMVVSFAKVFETPKDERTNEGDLPF